MVEVKARYKDSYSHGHWSQCEGTFDSLAAAIDWWGFKTDPKIEDYEIIEVKRINDN